MTQPANPARCGPLCGKCALYPATQGGHGGENARLAAALPAAPQQLMGERFGRDIPLFPEKAGEAGLSARIVDRDGPLGAIACARSQTMRQIAANPAAAVCGEWFAAHGVGGNQGWLGAAESAEGRW